MENRFGLKDLLVIALLIGLIVSVWLEMIRRDRQWEVLQQVHSSVSSQTEQINWIKNQLEAGAGAPKAQPGESNATSSASSSVPLFPRIVEARQRPDFAEGDWYVWPVAVTIKKLTPHVSGDVYQSWVESFIVQSLATYNAESGEWEPVIAESWTRSDDGLTFRFKLRRGVRFSDGTPLTAHDVVFTYNWVMDPKINAPRTRAYWEKIQDVRAEDDYTVVFQMRDTYFMGFVNCAGMGIMSQKYYSQFTPEEFNEMPGLLFGSGPWKLNVDGRDWKPGTGSIELVRNTQYWAPRPGLDRIVFREITDDTARLTAFRNGELDVFPATPQQYLSLKDDPTVFQQANLHIYDAINGGYSYIGWNQLRNGEPTLFADQRVRQALSYLIDRKVICERIMAGLAEPANGPFHPLGEQDDPQLEPAPYDLDKGKALLQEAGFVDRDGDGVIEGPSGAPFRFKLIYSSSSPTTEEMVFYCKDALARAGIVLEPDPLDWTIIQQRLDDRNFEAMTLGWGAGWVESDVYQMFHSSQIADGGDNYVHYQSEKFDRLVEQARVTVDPQERYKLWRQIHRTLYEEQPYLFLNTRKSVVFIDKRFQNVRILPTGMIDTISEWYVPRELQRRGR